MYLFLVGRNLASDQRAAAAIEAEAIADKFREEAKQRQVEAGQEHGRGKLNQKIGEPIDHHKNQTDHKLAETFGTNRQYIAEAVGIAQQTLEGWLKDFTESLTAKLPVKFAFQDDYQIPLYNVWKLKSLICGWPALLKIKLPKTLA
ncbi:MAG: hypothetical protein QF535_15580 [Anaerolineales bacterium]|nr:hypothetical protein [Anaerolineales bacterium]